MNQNIKLKIFPFVQNVLKMLHSQLDSVLYPYHFDADPGIRIKMTDPGIRINNDGSGSNLLKTFLESLKVKIFVNILNDFSPEPNTIS